MVSAPQIITERARAKVNLTLHVGRVIADIADRFYGYHPLDSLVVFADIADEITAQPASETSLDIIGPFAKGLDAEADNLILKAVKAVSVRCDIPALAITLTKNLPVSAGLGGGSANAAAMLRILQNFADLPIDEWRAIALALGADVPVCLASKTSHMTGIGEGVAAITGLGRWPALLVNPGVPTPTGEVFNSFDNMTGVNAPRETPRPQKHGGDMLARTVDGRNDLEPPAIRSVPIINDVLRELSAQSGAQIARMSGSGASCFALFERPAAAQAAALKLSQAYPKWWVQSCEFGE